MLTNNSCTVRYLDRSNNDNQVKVFSTWWEEQLKIFGTKVKYYTKGYDTNIDDPIYAEDFTTAFGPAKEIVVGANITNDASMLSKFGITVDSDMTIMIHMQTFKDVFGPDAEPKSGDVVELEEVGFDRPHGRGAPKYVVTARDDDDFPAGVNPLMSHFLWYLKLKRFEFSHEPGITPEPGSVPVDDNTAVDTEVQTHPSTSGTYTGHEDEVYGNY